MRLTAVFFIAIILCLTQVFAIRVAVIVSTADKHLENSRHVKNGYNLAAKVLNDCGGFTARGERYEFFYSCHEYLTTSEMAKVAGETINQTKKDQKKTRDLKITLGI